MNFYPLLSRKILQVSGSDRKTFLQGLVTCNIEELSEESALYGAFLTPQGRVKTPFFLFEDRDTMLLDLPSASSESIRKYLLRMRLRNKLDFTFSSLKAFAAPAKNNLPNGYRKLNQDPRLAELGWRGLYEAPEETFRTNNKGEMLYKDRLAEHGVADDEIILNLKEKNYPSELNLDLLNAISWTKGCYAGQEITARFYHRSLTKRRLLPLKASFSINLNDFSQDTLVHSNNNESSGTIVYMHQSGLILAMIDKKYWDESVFRVNGISFYLQRPAFWEPIGA